MKKRTRLVIFGLILVPLVVVGASVAAVVLALRWSKAPIDELEARARPIREAYEARFEMPEGEEPLTAPAMFKDLVARLEAMKQEPEYVAAAEALDERDVQTWTDEDFQVLAELVSKQADFIKDIRQLAALEEPVAKADLSNIFTADLAYLVHFRDMERLLYADGALCARKGRYDAAIEDYVALLRLARPLSKDPVLLAQLVSFSMASRAFHGVGQTIPPRETGPTYMRRLLEESKGLSGRASLADALVLEGVSGVASIEVAGRGDADYSHGYGLRDDDYGIYNPVMPPIIRLNASIDKRVYAHYMVRLVELAPQPYYEAWPDVQRVEEQIEQLPVFCFYSWFLATPLCRTFTSHARNEAVLALLRMGLLLEAHHAENGAYPDSLEALAGELGGSVPVDPFSGESYVYRREGDGFTLYSIGENLNDDGGRHDYRTGDIVWRGVAAEKEESRGRETRPE